MASTDPGPSVGLQHQNDELVKTPVQVLWTPAEAEPDSSPWTLPLVLRIHYNPALALAYFQLQHRHVTVKNGASKKSFYLYVPLERIDRLTLARTEYSAALDKDAYRLDVVLTEPLDLVGPPGHGCQEGWPGGKITTEKLRSLAATGRFSLLAPSAAVPKMKLADFCAAASRGLRSLATLYDTNTLYAGAGGHLFVRPRAPAPSPLVNNADPSPSHVSIVPREYAAPGPSHVPSVPLMPGGVPKHSVPSPQSDVSTVPVETPPRYRDDMALPEYSHVERGGPSKALDLDAHQAEAKTPAGKRPTSREPEPCPPSKRRFEDPSLLLDGEFHASWDESRLHPFASALASGDVLGREREPSLDTLVRLLMAQNQAYAIQYRAQQDTIDELRNELCQLARKHADHERQVAQQQELAEQATVMRARQDQMERLLTTLCRDVAALEKEAADVPQQLQAVRAEIERAVRTGVADALRGVATDDYLREVVTDDSLRGLVTDVVHDFFDELPPVVEDAIEDRVRDFVKSRVELFSAQLRQVFEEGA